MRRRDQKKLMKTLKWAAIGGLTADVATAVFGYYYYRKLTNSSEFRYKVYQYDSRFIDMYYRANEKFGDGKARKRDFENWGVTKVDSFSFVSHLGL